MNNNLLITKIKSNNWTTYRLAKQMNLEQNRIEKVVNGKVKDPRISTVVKIAKALELSEHEFAELCEYMIDSNADESRKNNENALKKGNFNKINPLKENVHSKINKELFLQHGFHLVRIDCYKENTENKRYVYCRIKDVYNQGDLSNLVISKQTIDPDSNIILDTQLEQVFINCDRLDQDLMLLIVAKTFELGWGVHSKLIDLNNTIINNYKNRISQENNTKYDEIYNNPLNWIKSLNIPDNQISFYNKIFTIDTSLKNIINIVMKIQQDGYDISNYKMLDCYHLKDEDDNGVIELYIVFKNKLSNEEFLILYDINTLNISFGYRTKNGENFSPLYDIKTCINHFDPNYCYLYR